MSRFSFAGCKDTFIEQTYASESLVTTLIFFGLPEDVSRYKANGEVCDGERGKGKRDEKMNV